jgi:hypothetical protein
MNDRELLELAAKAAGIPSESIWPVSSEYLDKAWNPLTDDGDALRLAVKLCIDIKHYDLYVVCWAGFIGTGKIMHDQDPDAATRRAIVLAAAEIGRSMP